MERRIYAMAAAAAAMTLLGAYSASASQCTQACDKSYQQCNGTTANSTKCLPAWGTCKKACAGPVATAAKPASTVVATSVKPAAPTSKAKVTKVADAKTKAKGAAH